MPREELCPECPVAVARGSSPPSAHNVSASRAEGAGPAGVQVGVIQRQQDLDIVVAVSLQEMGGKFSSSVYCKNTP